MNSLKYNCEKCNFVTYNLTNYNIHISTKKHTNQEIIECNFECNICNKKYKGQSGLWQHKKTCRVVIPKNSKILNEVINEKQKEINEKQTQTIEALKEQHHKDMEELKILIIEQPAPMNNVKTQ